MYVGMELASCGIDLTLGIPYDWPIAHTPAPQGLVYGAPMGGIHIHFKNGQKTGIDVNQPDFTCVWGALARG